MSEFRNLELRRLDVTLLLVFLGLMRHRKAATVADALGVTPSTVSHALARLRDVFADPLFLRRPHGLAPTAVATALEPRVRRAVEELDRALAGPEGFDPATSDQVLRLAAYDTELSTHLPRLVGRVLDEAPHMRVVARAVGRRDALAGLDAGDLDLAVGFYAEPPPAVIAEALFEEDYEVVMRADSPLARGRMTVERYAAERHLVVSPAGDLHGVVDDALAAQGLERRVVLAVPLFLPALAMAAETGLVATVPRQIAQRFASRFGLVALAPPFAVRRFTVAAVRHRRDARNAMLDWVVAALREIVAT